MDEQDNQFIRCNNTLQICSACFSLCACFVSIFVGGEVGDAARCASNTVECCACCFASSVSGCMFVQIVDELAREDPQVAVVNQVEVVTDVEVVKGEAMER